ncbi:hypothetical protein LCGC14_1957400 [marine sediment metagenome]|uniref:Uncharacterized protein n=1 Tax=marine sediment metagenome TaxID=412755 RepID=A0A0F9FFU5_9ZZZZ
MNPLREYKDNPGFGDEDHGDLWAAMRRNYLRMEKLDDRIRSAIVYCFLPITSFIIALQLALLGIIVGHMVLAG